MSHAIGGSSPSTRPAHGELWFDVRDFGAKGDNGITDNAGPIQATIDALAAKLNYNVHGPKGVVYVPSALGAYVVSKTIWVDCPNLEIRGDGWGSQVQMNGSAKHTVFQFGVRRTEATVVNGATVPLNINSSNRPDLFGKLDATAAPSAGTMWGIRTNSNSFVQIQASPLSAGVQSSAGTYYSDYWTETTKLTIEFCVEPPDGQQFPTGQPLIALGSIFYQPSPITISIRNDPNSIWITFRTSDFGPNNNAGARCFEFSTAGATRPYRIAVQIDLDNALCAAFVNGAQVGFTSTINLTSTGQFPFVPNSGLRFQQNDYFPLLIGAQGPRGPLFSSSTGIDLRLYGLRFSNNLRYQNNGVGNPQKRADSPSSAITDSYAYFGNDANTIGFLKLTDNPTNAGRVVSVQHGNTLANGGVGSGIFLHAPNSGGIIGNAVRFLAIGAGNGHGQAISIGGVLEMEIENVKAVYGFQGIGSLNSYANYYVHLKDCWLSGYDSAYYGAYQLMTAQNIYCESSGRATVRFLGSSADWNGTLVAYPAGNAECIFKLHSADYGGNFNVANLTVDFEGSTLGLAAFYCEAHYLTPATSLTLRNIELGTVGPNAALIMLKDLNTQTSGFNPCWLSVDNIQAYTNIYSSAVDVDGPLWHGEMTGVALQGPQFNHRKKWGVNTGILIQDTKYVAPPRTFSWYAGAHALQVRSPADGQFSEWRCTSAGAYGTATPPKWFGLNPINITNNGIATYILNHCYITIVLN